MKVDIIYRCCGKEVGPRSTDSGVDLGVHRESRPEWFSKRKCYKSAWDMTDRDPGTFSMHVIYDGDDSPLLDYIRHSRTAHDAIRRVAFNSYASIGAQWDYADTLTGDWIYFVEDDYLHTPDAGRVFMEGANRFQLFTLYDHLDRYHRTDDITAGAESIALTESCHWRTAESTCMTWAVSRSLWEQVRDLARERGPNDRHLFQDLVRRGIRLWQPMPGRATHCMKGYMSPLVDWAKVSAGVHL